jgi:hypothetical protein
MKYLQITPETTLSDLAQVVGQQNVDYILNANGLKRGVNIGKQLFERDLSGTVDAQSKINTLNTLVANSDVYEKAALGDEKDWVSLSAYGTFPDHIRIPQEIQLPSSDKILGNNEPISTELYNKCIDSLKEDGTVHPEIFTEYSVAATTTYGALNASSGSKRTDPFEWFKLPWGKISLYSHLSGESMDFPVYPEEYSDGYTANYDQMPNMLYQYEPWYVYKDSGPRSNSFSFHMHRDMWTGDHRDGLANKLVRFCEANCFPDYQGSAVNAPRVTLYLNGKNLITGIMTSAKADWTGPLGLDGYYLELTLTLEITEVSDEPLNYNTVKSKGLIS